jgi:hypothetical protein
MGREEAVFELPLSVGQETPRSKKKRKGAFLLPVSFLCLLLYLLPVSFAFVTFVTGIILLTSAPYPRVAGGPFNQDNSAFPKG